jgi:hypothetical protein
MPGFQQLSWAATGLQTEVATLQEFDRRGWIKTVEKNDSTFIAADQRYRARFILHLRNKKHLSDQQIDLVLSVQRPPYSTAELDRILREHAPTDGLGAG